MRIATDGSSGQRHGLTRGAWAWVEVSTSGRPLRPAAQVAAGDGFNPTETEILAVRDAVAHADPGASLTVLSDCRTVVAVLDRLDEFAGRDFRRSDRSPKQIAYAHLYRQVAELVFTRPGPTRFEWVRGHASHQGNRVCDQAARARLRADLALVVPEDPGDRVHDTDRTTPRGDDLGVVDAAGNHSVRLPHRHGGCGQTDLAHVRDHGPATAEVAR